MTGGCYSTYYPIKGPYGGILSGGVYLFVSLAHFGLDVVPILIDLVNEGVKLLASFLMTCKHTTGIQPSTVHVNHFHLVDKLR